MLVIFRYNLCESKTISIEKNSLQRAYKGIAGQFQKYDSITVQLLNTTYDLSKTISLKKHLTEPIIKSLLHPRIDYALRLELFC